MRLGYTEFSFGYAFTENLIRSSMAAPKSAPVFPNLVQEARAGYDVRIDFPGLPLFFQYKLPELMKRSTAFEIAKHNLPGLTVPFFRMPLMPSGLSRQHELLMELKKKYPETVLYASPSMENRQAFNRAYAKGEVHQRSVFFSPGDIGPLPDAKAHSIAYQDGSAVAYLCSEPKRIRAINFHALEEHAHSLFERPRFRTLREAATEMRREVRSIVSASMREAEGIVVERIRARRTVQPGVTDEQEQRIEDILVAREMARVDLGVDLMIAQPRSPS